MRSCPPQVAANGRWIVTNGDGEVEALVWGPAYAASSGEKGVPKSCFPQLFAM